MNDKPEIIKEPELLRRACDDARGRGQTVALVPTMGALHQGHLSLIEAALPERHFIVLTIFVNPKQFGEGEDFDRYPRDLAGDLNTLSGLGVDIVFAPAASAMFPAHHKTVVAVEELSDKLCGAFRPGHFSGVTTVVAKLFGIVGPCRAVFGRKDYQQFKVISRMVRDLNMPVEMLGIPTYREKDGLAMSSRNAYLSTDERRRARALSAGLADARELFAKGIRRVGDLRNAALAQIEKAVDRLDYLTAADPETLDTLSDDVNAGRTMLLAVAAHIGKTRLIDNIVLGEDELPRSSA